jgi:putative hemolysin
MFIPTADWHDAHAWTDPAGEKSRRQTGIRMRTSIEALRLLVNRNPSYSVRLARTAREVRGAQALRFDVFNLELNEGLEQSFATGLDADSFDDVCDHLIVEHLPTGDVIGTYRLQTGASAAAKLGYYSAQEFDFAPFESVRAEMIELGRACVHQMHRNMSVLGLLWRGISDYAGSMEADISAAAVPSPRRISGGGIGLRGTLPQAPAVRIGGRSRYPRGSARSTGLTLSLPGFRSCCAPT